MPNIPLPAGDFDNTDPFLDEPNHEETERRMNINRLKNEANEITGGQMSLSESSDAPSEILEEFWKNVVAFERAPLTTLHDKLAVAGIAMPDDSDLNDAQLTTKLWEIIRWSAENGAVYENTNHLSDRELYVWLRDHYFHQRENYSNDMVWHASPIGSYGAEEMIIYNRYYADEAERADWAGQFPEEEMPPHEALPFDRDKSLPG